MTASWRRAIPRRIATVRAGNVIGGGDYGEDRIVPDCIRALSRHLHRCAQPDATRPWQRARLSVRLPLAGRAFGGRAWPTPLTSGRAEAQRRFWSWWTLLQHWPGEWTDASIPTPAKLTLSLNIDKAATVLDRMPVWDFAEAVQQTARWYQQRHQTNPLRPRIYAGRNWKPTPRRPPLNPAFGLADMEVTGSNAAPVSLDGLLVLDLGEQPLANNFLSPEDLDQPEPAFRCGWRYVPNAGCCRSPISCRRWNFSANAFISRHTPMRGGTRRRVRGRTRRNSPLNTW